MATEKKITSRIQQKHDVAANWAKATNFIPKKGEIIIYDAEYNASGEETQAVRFKIGDGSKTVNNLPFAAIDYKSIKSINTNNTAAQEPKTDESIAGSGTINLHKIAKTGNYNDLLDKLTAGSNITINENNVISAKDTTYTFTANNPTLAWNTTSKIGTIGNVEFNVTMPANPNTDTHYTNFLQIKGNGTEAVKFTQDANKTLNFKPGTNVSISATSGEITISSTDTNTSHSHSAGIGLVGSGNAGTNNGTYDYKAKLRSETALTVDSVAATTTPGRVYPVAVDKSGYLSVNVPWTDTDTNTHNSHAIISGTKSDNSTQIKGSASSGDIILGDSGASAGSYGNASNQEPGYGTTFNVPYITVNAKGIVTAISNKTVKIPASDNTNTATAADNILDGSNSGTQITYKPYTSQQSKLSFDTSTTNPTRTDRLNLNGHLHATKLYSGGKEVLTSHQNISGKLDKTTYEWNKEFRAGSNGAISLGRYNIYDTQLTFDISSTTNISMNGKLVIATQNGRICQAKVFGDATGTLVSKIVIYQSAIANNRSWIEIFCNFDGWSKNKAHIYGVALESATVTNQMSSVTFTNGVPSPITSGDSKWSGTIDNDLSKKQDKLTAGSNISISGNTISATVPTVNNGKLTIQKNGTNVATFTANQSGNSTANITVPTKTSELTNNSGFLTSHQTIYDLIFRNALGSDYVTFSANESGTTVVPIDVETINETTEEYSLAIGGVTTGAQAQGKYCVALGSNAKARYDNTVKIGYGMTSNIESVTQINTGSYTSTGRALYLGAGRKGFTYMNAAGSSWTSASDIRDKTDIKEIDHALDFIKKLKPITYVMNDRERYLIRDENDNPILDSNGKQQYDIEAHKRGDKKKHRRFAGLSAQDTYQAMLDCYNNDTNYAQIVDNNKFDHPDDEYLEQYSMSYERLVPFLIKAIQEQQEQIEKLKSKLGE